MTMEPVKKQKQKRKPVAVPKKTKKTKAKTPEQIKESVQNTLKEIDEKKRKPWALLKWYNNLRSPVKILIATAILTTALAATSPQGRQSLRNVGKQAQNAATAVVDIFSGGAQSIKKVATGTGKVLQAGGNAAEKITTGVANTTTEAANTLKIGIRAPWEISRVVQSKAQGFAEDWTIKSKGKPQEFQKYMNTVKHSIQNQSEKIRDSEDVLRVFSEFIPKNTPPVILSQQDVAHRSLLMKDTVFTTKENFLRDGVPFFRNMKHTLDAETAANPNNRIYQHHVDKRKNMLTKKFMEAYHRV